MENCSEIEDETEVNMIIIGSYGGKVKLLRDGEDSAAEEIMLLWGIQQPTHSKPNSFVSQSSLELHLDACGHSLSILQSPSSLGTPGVTGSVMWDSGVVLGKFLEHAVDSKMLMLHGKKVIELGAGCGLVGCIAALLGAQVTLTDLPDRLRLLKKNVESNLRRGGVRGSAVVKELIWGDELDKDLIEPLPDYDRKELEKNKIAIGWYSSGRGFFVIHHLLEQKFQIISKLPTVVAFQLRDTDEVLLLVILPAYAVVGSDVIYSEGAVMDLLDTLVQLCGTRTTIFLAGELRNDSVLEYFLEAAMKEFVVGRVEQMQWHPDYHSCRVVLYVLIKK